MVKDKIKELAKGYKAEIIANRRYLHAHPELSFQEYQTSAFVEEKLKSFGITRIEKKADTGIVALIEGRNPSLKTIALRGDMDALPIVEENEVPYKSINPGVMHACGHDVQRPF
jgi:amidohydrolase